ncbi:PADRE domain [Dillenia turbinata]|uniref:PADRE domain n=1 Tax=Dillenia turbinata TaxID=194707 RepID=A0AAN8ULV2_9MAGN
MGICSSSQGTSKLGGNVFPWSSSAKVIYWDGRVQEFKQPVQAGSILSLNPNTFICSSEFMHINSFVPPLPDHEELQCGQLYFLLPQSYSIVRLSLQDLCALAIKASAALGRPNTPYNNFSSRKLPSFSHKNSLKLAPEVGAPTEFRQVEFMQESKGSLENFNYLWGRDGRSGKALELESA